MQKMIISDVEELAKKKKQIAELQKEIDKLNEKITKFSTFDLKLIGDTLAKLMSKFEDIPYEYIQQDFGDEEYFVKPKFDKYSFLKIYPMYELKKMKIDNPLRKWMKETPPLLTCLPPSMSNCKLNANSQEIGASYIQLFINFLYVQRVNINLYEVTNKDLETMLQEFLLLTKDLQHQRKEEIAKKTEEALQIKKRLEFEESCIIDRKLIYNSLAYVINHYEDNILATQEYEEDEWSHSTSFNKEVYGYHNLLISDGNKKICFKAKVDHKACEPNEYYCQIFLNKNKDTNISFFELKNSIRYFINNYVYVEKFMNMIEDLYNKNVDVKADNIQKILVLISNDKKAKTHTLKKKR